MHYAGTFIDGSEFDSSYKRGQPTSFGVNQVIKGTHSASQIFASNIFIKCVGWTEGLQLMSVGDKYEFYIPYLSSLSSLSSLPSLSFLSFLPYVLSLPSLSSHPFPAFPCNILPISWDLAYGAAGRPPKIPKYSTLVFVVELFDINGKTDL